MTMKAFISNPFHVKPSSLSSTSSLCTPKCHRYSAVKRRPRAVLSERRPHIKQPKVVKRALSPVIGNTTSPSSRLSSAKSSKYVQDLRKLATANGALGRGVRATLRAFYRRANFMLPKRKIEVETMGRSSSIYVEIGPAYVLSMGRQGSERVTRYSVEQRAWPILHKLLNWKELTTSDARKYGAPLRKLGNYGERYGRHVFLSYDALSAMISVAEDLISDSINSLNINSKSNINFNSNDKEHDALAAVLDVQIEAAIQLKRRPIAGIRTVAANCPRGEAHSNHDRNPSLVLWMNDDGVTGGAMCPVCMESDSISTNLSVTKNKNSNNPNQNIVNRNNSSSSRHMTWRVHYIQRNTAVLCTPHRRINSPPHVTRAVQEWNDKYMSKKKNEEQTKNKNSSSEFLSSKLQSHKSKKSNSLSDLIQKPKNCDIQKNGINEKESKKVTHQHPIGGYVMKDKKRLEQLGKVTSLAYVTASLKIASKKDTAFNMIGAVDHSNHVDGVKLRTIGSKAKLGCPMQVLLWSERRSKGPISARRIEDVSWYAKQSLLSSDSTYDEICSIFDDDQDANGDEGEDISSTASNNENENKSLTSTDTDDTEIEEDIKVIEGLESEEWLPTPIVSVSAMRVCNWREVIGNNGQLISVPASWEAVAQEWILYDIDDIELDENNTDSTEIIETVVSKITLTIRRNLELSGRCLVLQSGPRGLHVWAELREVREEAKAWFKLDETRYWYMDVGKKILKAAHKGGARGGKIDPSSCCAGRFARRPGWRLLEDGTAFRSRVVTYVPSRVKGRTPRI